MGRKGFRFFFFCFFVTQVEHMETGWRWRGTVRLKNSVHAYGRIEGGEKWRGIGGLELFTWVFF